MFDEERLPDAVKTRYLDYVLMDTNLPPPPPSTEKLAARSLNRRVRLQNAEIRNRLEELERINHINTS